MEWNKMTEYYRKKTIEEIENDFDKMMNETSKYQLSKITGVNQSIFTKVKQGERTFSIEKKIEMLEKYHRIEN